MRIGLLQILTKVNFADQEFTLSMPIFGGHMCNVCSQLQQHHTCLLTSKPKHFAQGKLGLLSFIHWSSSTSQPEDTSPLTNAIDALAKVSPRNLEVFHLK